MRILLCVMLLLGVLGCSDVQLEKQQTGNKLEGQQPPKAKIQIGKQMYETKLGTYCWRGGCADSIGPVEVLKNETPISVNSGELLRFVMDYQPQPNKFYVEQIREGKPKEITVRENSFHAPSQKGIYYYSFGVWWMDKHVKNQSNGNAFYYFVLEVT